MLVLAAAVLLLVDTFLPWQRLSIGGFSYSWSAWHGDKGVLIGVMTIVLIALVVARVAGLRVADGLATPSLAVLVLIFAVVKNVRDEDSAWPGYVGVALATVVAATALLAYREARR
jgi:hypothetical protein